LRLMVFITAVCLYMGMQVGPSFVNTTGEIFRLTKLWDREIYIGSGTVQEMPLFVTAVFIICAKPIGKLKTPTCSTTLI